MRTNNPHKVITRLAHYESNADGSFHTTEETLEDNSRVFDVYFSTSEGQELIANAPTEQTATEMAAALNTIRERFLSCGSDREVVSLARSFDAWVKKFDRF